jgi:hypothetical protein
MNTRECGDEAVCKPQASMCVNKEEEEQWDREEEEEWEREEEEE